MLHAHASRRVAHPLSRAPRTPDAGERRAGGRTLAWLRAASALFAALALASCSHDDSRPRGVLLVSIDSLRADHLSCYGYRSATAPELDTTPVIDRLLARRGVRFTRAVSTTSWTLPAHMALLTGLPDEIHGVREVGFRLADSHALLAELFRAQGWRTAGFWSGPNLHPFFGFARGFELYEDCSSSRVSDADTFAVQHGMSEGEVAAKRGELKEVHDASHHGITGPALVDAFERWFADLGADERFFAFVHLWDVHYDYEPPPEFDLFYPGYRGSETGAGVHERSLERDPPDRDGLARIVSLYDGEIRFTDHSVGRLLDLLEARARLDDTFVVLTADHGEEFLDHQMFGHGNSLYEEVVRIPLILRFPPEIPAGLELDVPVSLVDVAPTLLDFCGIAAPRALWGQSLRSALSGGTLERLLPLERSFLRPGQKLSLETIRGAHAGDHKLIRQTDEDGGKMFFYDLAADPREERPVPTGALDKSDARVRAVRELWKSLDARAGRMSLAEMPERLVEDLGKTGYLQGTEHADEEND